MRRDIDLEREPEHTTWRELLYMAFGILLLVAVIAGCTGDKATDNRDRLGAAQTILLVAQDGVLAYRNRPPCGASGMVFVCRDSYIYGEMQRIMSIATEANNSAYTAIKRDPAAPSTKYLVDAALAGINAAATFSKEQTAK